jgi:hypothetical protein
MRSTQSWPKARACPKRQADEVVLMKDWSGRVIRFEKLNFQVPESDFLQLVIHGGLEHT